MYSEQVITDLKSDDKVLVLQKKEWDRLKAHLDSSRLDMEYNMTQKVKSKYKDMFIPLSRSGVPKVHKNIHHHKKAKVSETKSMPDEYEDFQKIKQKEQRDFLEEEKKKMFYMKEHVKALNSAFLFSEVLRERNAQLEFERKLKEEFKRMHKQCIEHCKRQYKDYLQQERREQWSFINKTKRIRDELISQITERNEHIRQAENMEMERDKKNALYMEQEMKESNIKEKLKEKTEKEDLLRKYLVYLESERLIREKLRHEKESQDQITSVYNELRNEMAKLRQQKEKELQARKMKKIEKTALCLKASMVAVEPQEEALLWKAIFQNNLRLKNHKTKREALREKMKNDIIQYHEEFLESQKQQKMQDLELQNQIMELRLKQEEVNKRYFQQRKEERDQLNKLCKEICDQQVKEKQDNLQKQQDEDMKLFNDMVEANNEENKQFLAYVNEIIADSEQKGRPLFPIIKCAREYKKRNNLLAVVKVPPLLVSRIPINQQSDYRKQKQKHLKKK